MAKRDRDGDDEMADAGAMEGGNPDAEAMLIEKFLAAVKAGDADTTRACLAEDADLVTLEDNDTQWSPLHHGALPNCRTPFLNVQSPAPAHPGFLLLVAAAVKGAHLPVVRELLKKGAAVGATTHHDSTALHICACNAGPAQSPEMITNMERICTLLLDRGCPTQALDNKKNSALHRAAQHGSAGILRTLLLIVGDDGSRNLDGQSVMDRAVASGHEQTIALVTQYAQTQAGPSTMFKPSGA
jgi:ankyrin repeat protein